MSDSRRCAFTLTECDGGEIYEDGMVGCGYWDSESNSCKWMDELDGRDPREFYNEQILLALSE